MDVEVEVVDGMEFVVKCPCCEGTGEIENLFAHEMVGCPLCDGEGSITAEIDGDQMMYAEVDESLVLESMRP